jgi:hypothetical protein
VPKNNPLFLPIFSLIAQQYGGSAQREFAEAAVIKLQNCADLAR